MTPEITKYDEFVVLSPTAILGYGFPIESFKRGIDEKPNLIAVDAGSTDPGPYYLGSGHSFTDREFVKRDLRIMINAGLENSVPVVIGTAGGSGSLPHLKWCEEIINEIAAEDEISFKMAVIPSDISKETVSTALKSNKIRPLKGVKELTQDLIEQSTGIVAQMGMKPFIEALNQGCDVVLAGRSYDPAVFAALPVSKGYDVGLSLHMGKILECAAIASTPGSGADCALGRLRNDSFILEPLNPSRKFTCESTAAHTLYEKTDPYHLPGPGGELDLTDCSFTQITENSVMVKGTKFIPEKTNTVKLEGARVVGYRSISIAGIRDPLMISAIDTILEEVKQAVENMGKIDNGDIYFHVYGKNGVMGPLEPLPPEEMRSHELAVVIEAIGDTQKKADTLCSVTRSTLLHFGYENRISTAGNLAFPFSPSDIRMGEVYEFSIYHLMEIEPEFQVIIKTVGK
ncbi:MAG: acyclic terpene utilization AtuA family protein [Deltaproteobacteria bacterium]|nr:acyclic terpene utilization AtuA family protein [Deltaproteobacteria bacterium]